MKLIDENGETWEIVGEGMTAGQRLDLLCNGSALIVDKVKTPANPMPSIHPGYMVSTADRDGIVINAGATSYLCWIAGNYNRLMRHIIDSDAIISIRNLDGSVTWSREGK